MKTQLRQQINFIRNKGWFGFYEEAAAKYNIPLHILLAKDSRESALGTTPGLENNGWIGSDGMSKGISQINMNAHSFAATTPGSDVRAYVLKGAEILKTEYNRFGNWPNALSAYNTGAGNVNNAIKAGIDPDQYTTHKNYAADVLERAEIIKGIVGTSSLVPAAVFVSTASFPKMGLFMLAAALLAGGIYALNKKRN